MWIISLRARGGHDLWQEPEGTVVELFIERRIDAAQRVEFLLHSPYGRLLAVPTESGHRTTVSDAAGRDVGWIDYAQDRPAEATLVPLTTDRDSSVSVSLRGDIGRVTQPRSAMFGARRRALHIAFDDWNASVLQRWGKLQLEALGSATTAEVHVRKGSGVAAGADAQRAAEVMFLLIAGGVVRHLSSLTM